MDVNAEKKAKKENVENLDVNTEKNAETIYNSAMTTEKKEKEKGGSFIKQRGKKKKKEKKKMKENQENLDVNAGKKKKKENQEKLKVNIEKNAETTYNSAMPTEKKEKEKGRP